MSRVPAWRALAIALLLLELASTRAESEWQSFTMPDDIIGIVEDSTGTMWFATEIAGLLRFDGSHWQGVPAPNTQSGVPSDWLTALCLDSKGGIWVGYSHWDSAYGVSRYDPDRAVWRSFNFESTGGGLTPGKVHSIVQEADGVLWFAADSGVSRYDSTTDAWRRYTNANTGGGLVNDSVSQVFSDRLGRMWFATRAGVSMLSTGDDTWTVYTDVSTGGGLGSGAVLSGLQDSSGALWFGTSAGLSRLDPVTGAWTKYTRANTNNRLLSDAVDRLIEDRLGRIYCVHTFVGISRFDGESWNSFTAVDMVPGSAATYIRAASTDHAGGLWIGLNITTVVRFDGVTWDPAFTRHFASSIQTIFEDRKGNLWFGGYGLIEYDRSRSGFSQHQVYNVDTITEDREGRLWCGISGQGGVVRYHPDSLTSTTFNAYIDTGLVSNSIRAIRSDRNDNIWVATPVGLSRYDAALGVWEKYTVESTGGGLVDDDMAYIFEDRSGDLWFASEYRGMSRFHPETGSWETISTSSTDGGMPCNHVASIVEDHSGQMWFATCAGLARYVPASNAWTTYTVQNTNGGLQWDDLTALAIDEIGNLWVGTGIAGAARFTGTSWSRFTNASTTGGLEDDRIVSILVDHRGKVWFQTTNGTRGVASIHEPDRVAPWSVIPNKPLPVVSSRSVLIPYTAALGEEESVEFSYTLDGAPWSAWTKANSWLGTDLLDDKHTWAVRSRDEAGNIDPRPATATFVVDATAPVPEVTAPSFGQVIRDVFVIRGTADDERFQEYAVEYRLLGTDAWTNAYVSLAGPKTSPIDIGPLATIDTRPIEEGVYQLRLSVTDALGLTGATIVSVIVDNEAPYADQTSPTTVIGERGGDVFTTHADAHLYIPPHAFIGQAIVSLEVVSDSVLPLSPSPDSHRRGSGYAASWGEAAMRKPSTLEIKIPEELLSHALAVWDSVPGAKWSYVGGTVDPKRRVISAVISGPGAFAVFEQANPVAVGRGLSGITFTPRAFSPHGTFARTYLTIGFTIGQAAPVTVKIYNRAGRLVRVLLSDSLMGSGANVATWDGKDRDGRVAPGDLYVVSVESQGQTMTGTVAVVE